MLPRCLRGPAAATVAAATAASGRPLSQRRHISALYVTGDKASQAYVALTPYFDFKSRLADADAASRLAANIAARQPATGGGASAGRHAVDVGQLLQLWSMFRDVQQRKAELERRRVQIADTLKAMTKTTAGTGSGDQPPTAAAAADLLHKYRADGALCRDDLKRLKENSYALEDTFVHEFLALPNELHPRTPCARDVTEPPTILHSHLSAPHDGRLASSDRGAVHHLSGRNGHLIEYHSPYCYYLLDEAADFELAAAAHFAARFRRAGFVRTSNPDFCRALVVEAAGLDGARELLAVLEDGDDDDDGGSADGADAAHINRTHLTGAGSMASFLGYCAKLMPFQSALPLRLIAAGRTYVKRDATAAAAPSNGLYGVAQSTTVQSFEAAASAAEAVRLFDETVALLAGEYAQFGRAMRIVQVPACRLRAAEAMRADCELWSDSRQAFVRVADVAYYGDYISKRLLFSYKETAAPLAGRPRAEATEPRFAHLVSATAVDVSRLLAVLLEGGAGQSAEFRVPECLRGE